MIIRIVALFLLCGTCYGQTAPEKKPAAERATRGQAERAIDDQKDIFELGFKQNNKDNIDMAELKKEMTPVFGRALIKARELDHLRVLSTLDDTAILRYVSYLKQSKPISLSQFSFIVNTTQNSYNLELLERVDWSLFTVDPKVNRFTHEGTILDIDKSAKKVLQAEYDLEQEIKQCKSDEEKFVILGCYEFKNLTVKVRETPVDLLMNKNKKIANKTERLLKLQEIAYPDGTKIANEQIVPGQ